MSVQMTTEKAKEFERFLNETLRPDYLSTIERREAILGECREYEFLLIAIRKIQKANMESMTSLINLGQHVFVHAEVDNCKKVIVKMIDDLFVELPLDRALVFIEGKMKVLSDRVEQVDTTASKIRAHMDLILSSLDELYAIQK